MSETPSFAAAVAPERSRRVASMGLELQVHEWGAPDAPPVVLCHGMFDHGRGFDVLAPLLTERFRVVAYDARGHGDSEHADAYAWSAELVDLSQVLRSVGRPAHLVGHSKGGGQATDTAAMCPELVRHLVNIDGFGPPPEGFTPLGQPPMTGGVPERFRSHLDRRRRQSGWRAYPDLEALVERRLQQNPRLAPEWLRYFCHLAARPVEGGWTWKADPIASLGFGPWRPDWIAPAWRNVRAPMLAITGSEPDTWGPLPEPVIEDRLSYLERVERRVVAGAGHFVHMEKPRETAEILLDFLPR